MFIDIIDFEGQVYNIYVLDVVSYVFVLWEWGIFVVVGFVEVYQGS